ncbi:cytochrome c-type biogenesis protein [Sinorhizobium meliloti]|jgi:cytochrome c-type biogenesis protein|uniref:Cytochrome c-type biogenesis protein n=4 Tax=Rhizobium meliloti TaxID=382 RepID=Q7BQ76_RHIML|nr:cytochrome c-type biogenesis protein [Sinorhizobium meliloti]AEG04341.1 cytochrome c biogenesis protein transmembrane region [Sinorhizobium meliloti BL225C]AEG53318.1 cytochrome c biogenesis protein transmembrane region [Sinorhizobium meliloti AK83]AEH79001.1 putative cytochrome C-type biogenesis protein [Sinorhizobium meliloti SM11]TWB05083.1 cytochrome c-type biogenesis protein [Ensifer sp. SEMIA 134]TWB39240.1 cytochrome c-type biogenesis protein [Ensifer sp. SEMIA 135]
MIMDSERAAARRTARLRRGYGSVRQNDRQKVIGFAPYMRVRRRQVECRSSDTLSIADISIWTAVLAGALSFLSPCVLPLVPPYLCYMAGVSVDQFRDGNAVATASTRRAVLPAALFFTLGFATVFVALGAGASSIGLLLRQHLDLLSRIGGIIIIIMGLHFLGVFRIGLLAREARFQGGKPATLSGAYVMGLAFAFGWTPCIGPVLGTILGVAAARDTVADGAALLAIYSLGLAVPFWIAAGFSSAFMRFLSRFRRHLGLIEKLMGALLVAAGLAFLFGFVSSVAIWFQQTFPILSQIG